MTNQQFINLLKLIKTELVKRYYNKQCGDFEIGCKNCQIQILIGLLNSEIDLQNWIKVDKKLPKL